MADCNNTQVCSIIGHEEKHAMELRRNYLAMRPEMAEAAGDKLEKWKATNGIKY